MDTLKEHIVIIVSITAISSFGTGWAAYKAVTEASGQELILRTRLAELKKKEAEIQRCNEHGSASLTPKSCARFTDCKWRYLTVTGGDKGSEVAERLTRIGPPSDAVVVYFDGIAGRNTFHVWYSGQGTGTKYTFAHGSSNDLSDPPQKNFFLPGPGNVPAGIGSDNVPVPIFFVATHD